MYCSTSKTGNAKIHQVSVEHMHFLTILRVYTMRVMLFKSLSLADDLPFLSRGLTTQYSLVSRMTFQTFDPTDQPPVLHSAAVVEHSCNARRP